MILELGKRQTKFFNTLMILSMLIGSMVLIEDESEFSSLLFFSLAIINIMYLTWKWFSNRRQERKTLKSTRKKEIIILSLITILISCTAIYQSYPKSLDTTLLITQIFTLNILIVISEQYSKSKLFRIIKSRKLYILLTILSCIISTLLLVLLIDESEHLINLIPLGLAIILLIYGIKWLVTQIKFIIDLKNEKAKTELMHLQSQVNPHFFFNVLNNLYGTVGKDPKQAQKIILKLSDMMRYSIYNGQKETATLQEEIDHLTNYIALNKMRYHKTIDINFEIEISDTSVKIVPLLYLMLLENAFKHGAEKLREGAYIKIRIENIENDIKFTVINNYDTTSTLKQKGIGLKNLKRRLELAYPEKHELKLMDKGGIYEAHLNLHIL